MNSKPTKLTALKIVLIPCDFSECSRRALDYAAVVAKPFSASLVLLHVIEPVQPGFLIEGRVSRQVQGRMRERARQELAAWLKRPANGLSFGRPIVKSGKPWEVIVSVASRTSADLIVMGTHGYTGVKHALLGSVAERVVRYAPCPVLTVRAKSRR